MGKRKGRSGATSEPAKVKAARGDVAPLPPPVAAQKVASAMLKEQDRDDADADDESGAAAAAAVAGVGVDTRTGEVRATTYRNKQRVLVLASRGITARHRHLLEDLRTLLPHHKKDSKLDTKGDVRSLNEICEVKSCNGALYLEARKRRDLYLWLSRTPHGPSGKFLVTNVHTMDELRLTGNCARGTRPLLAFCGGLAGPAAPPHWRLVRALLAATFGTPLGHPKSKPFFDHVLSFALVDGRVWVRHYQIAASEDGAKRAEIAAAARAGDDLTSLVEIGPRLVLQPIRLFAGAFGGATLYGNQAYTSPNAQRSAAKAELGRKYADKKAAQDARAEHLEGAELPRDPVESVFKG